MAKRKKIAIVGGGCAAMAAAWELTSPEQEEQYDVTVYQLGWRLGGKGASGRGLSKRIEEHGLHLWMGFYDNAFRLMREAYAELDRDPDKCEIATFEDAFSPHPIVGITEQTQNGEWSVWNAMLPMDDGLPGDPFDHDNPFSMRHYLWRLLGLARTLITEYYGSPEDYTKAQKRSTARLFNYAQIAALTTVVHAFKTSEDVLSRFDRSVGGLFLPLLDTVSQNALNQLRKNAANDNQAHRVWALIDLTFATVRGIVYDNLLTDERGFDAISHYDCREWLKHHGASDESLDTGYMRGLYDLIFGYVNGNPDNPSVDAGQALRGVFRSLFNYRGSFFWKMHAGMGDIVFTPLYEVLKKRGVKFEFFHRLTNVGLGNDGARHIESLDFDIQAEVKGTEYFPLEDVAGLPSWPAEPFRDQIKDPNVKKNEKRDYEDFWDTRRVGTKKLKVGRDFDFVVLGIGLGAVPYTCKELVESDSRWRNMVEKVKTVPTQAFQLWMSADMQDLGWTGPPITASGFVEPFDTWADMTHLKGQEQWPERIGAIAYFCNVLPEPEDGFNSREEAFAVVRENAIEFMEQDLPHLWPNCVTSDESFRWDVLTPQLGGKKNKNSHAFDTQFWTANINPTDRYTQSVPGSAAFRISPLDNKYDNLTICGDWTSAGFNVGCVEAAVMSGKLASHSLSGYPALGDIVAFDHP